MGSALTFGFWFQWVSPWLAFYEPRRRREAHQLDPDQGEQS